MNQGNVSSFLIYYLMVLVNVLSIKSDGSIGLNCVCLLALTFVFVVDLMVLCCNGFAFELLEIYYC